MLVQGQEIEGRSALVLTTVQRRALGLFLLLHALAHAAFGLWSPNAGGVWLVTSLWEVATIGFFAAGLGLLGLRPLTDWWRPLCIIGALASGLLFRVTPSGIFAVGLSIDVILGGMAILAQEQLRIPPASRKAVARLGRSLAWAALIYIATTIGFRPWYSQWGTSASERTMSLPGDQIVPVAHYRLDHGITINAPAEAVWPWINQIGQDRGGFYSYSRLENAVGAHVTNIDRVVPDWAPRRTGELVRAVPSNWFGGAFGSEIGWRIVQVEPGTALVLEGWGAFVLIPGEPGTTRMLIRTRGAGMNSIAGIALAPINLLAFEPAHFIMQRKMLYGIKARAERAYLDPNRIAR